MARKGKPKLAVFKFASCGGCQLSLLDLEDELLTLAGELEIAYFVEASKAAVRGPYDLTLVDGSITTEHDAAMIKKVRRASKFLVALGACATAGGIQALRNFKDVQEFKAAVYPRPEVIDTLDKSTPIAAQVQVDFELRGCPVNKGQLLTAISAFLKGQSPAVPHHSVCLECKLRGNICVLVARGLPCLGPVTHAGCGALCPTYHRGCYGCYGPQETPNTASLSLRCSRLGMTEADLVRVFRTFCAGAEPFRQESEAHEK